MFQTSAGGKFTEIPGSTDFLGICAYLRALCNYVDNELDGDYLNYNEYKLDVDLDLLYQDILTSLDLDGYVHFNYDWASLAGNHLTYTDTLNVDVDSLAASITASSSWTIGEEATFHGKQRWVFSPYSRVGSYTAATNTFERELYSSFIVTGFAGTVETLFLTSGLGDHSFSIQVSQASIVTVDGAPFYFYTPSWSYSVSWSGVTSNKISLNERIGGGLIPDDPTILQQGDYVHVEFESLYTGAWGPSLYALADIVIQEDTV